MNNSTKKHNDEPLFHVTGTNPTGKIETFYFRAEDLARKFLSNFSEDFKDLQLYKRVDDHYEPVIEQN